MLLIGVADLHDADCLNAEIEDGVTVDKVGDHLRPVGPFRGFGHECRG